MSAQHTPGPWFIRGKEKAVVMANNPDVGGDLIGIADCRTVDLSQEQAQANARLIAAAPELYDLLSTIENDSEQIPEWLWERIQKVLNKVKGE